MPERAVHFTEHYRDGPCLTACGIDYCTYYDAIVCDSVDHFDEMMHLTVTCKRCMKTTEFKEAVEEHHKEAYPDPG